MFHKFKKKRKIGTFYSVFKNGQNKDRDLHIRFLETFLKAQLHLSFLQSNAPLLVEVMCVKGYLWQGTAEAEKRLTGRSSCLLLLAE